MSLLDILLAFDNIDHKCLLGNRSRGHCATAVLSSAEGQVLESGIEDFGWRLSGKVLPG